MTTANGGALVIDTEGSSLTSPSVATRDDDTELGLYDAAGNRVAIDDDGGTDFLSRLSFGVGGANGELTAGTYYVAVSAFNTSFGADNFVLSSDSDFVGDAVVNFNFTPGTTAIDADFNDDGIIDGTDIDLLQANIATGPADPGMFDLTGDGQVTIADRNEWLAQAGAANLASGNPYLLGDANLDGFVDTSDFNIWNGSNFTFNSNWTNGDFNADGVVDASDFNAWNGNNFTSSDIVSRGLSQRGVQEFWSEYEENEREEQAELKIIDQLFVEWV